MARAKKVDTEAGAEAGADREAGAGAEAGAGVDITYLSATGAGTEADTEARQPVSKVTAGSAVAVAVVAAATAVVMMSKLVTRSGRGALFSTIATPKM